MWNVMSIAVCFVAKGVMDWSWREGRGRGFIYLLCTKNTHMETSDVATTKLPI